MALSPIPRQTWAGAGPQDFRRDPSAPPDGLLHLHRRVIEADTGSDPPGAGACGASHLGIHHKAVKIRMPVVTGGRLVCHHRLISCTVPLLPNLHIVPPPSVSSPGWSRPRPGWTSCPSPTGRPPDPECSPGASRELALMPRESATTMRVINHSRILAMDRMNRCAGSFSTLAEAVQSRSSSLSKMALITRQMTSNKGRPGWSSGPPPAPRSSWFTPCCTLFSRVSCQWCLYSCLRLPFSTWNNGHIEKKRAKQALPF